MDLYTLSLVAAALGMLVVLSLFGHVLSRQHESGLDRAVLGNFNARIRALWMMAIILAAAFLLGKVATVIIFGLISFGALREFITLTPTRLGDHRALFWVFLFFTPLQYLLVALDRFEFFSILIPVYGFLFIPARVALSGDATRFSERTARIQSGLIICVYCLSHAPALLNLEFAVEDVNPSEITMTLPLATEGQSFVDNTSVNTRLLLFLIVIVKLSDILQFIVGKWIGNHVVAPHISSSRTWEGFLASVGSSMLVGAALSWSVPFNIWQAALMALIITVLGFAGGMTMSAIKRDRGASELGTLIQGHGGVLDRIDSICFAAPVFFHLTRFFFSSMP